MAVRLPITVIILLEMVNIDDLEAVHRLMVK